MNSTFRITSSGDILVQMANIRASYCLSKLTKTARRVLTNNGMFTEQYSWWQVYNLVVPMQHQGRGYGNLLLEDVKNRTAAMHGCAILRSEPFAHRTLSLNQLHQFYTTGGFRCISGDWFVYTPYQ